MRRRRLAWTAAGAALLLSAAALADQVINDDLIVTGNLCVGLDCVNDEPFTNDAELILKENNTRILFEDTSSVTGFAGADFYVRANDNASGGPSNFFIAQGTNEGATPLFWCAAGAPDDALVVSKSGAVGFSTASPVLSLHAVSNNTPGLRLEQPASAGRLAQTWDVASNEANFFVRDMSGSRLVLRIKPGAPSNSLVVDARGYRGFGTLTPVAPLHSTAARFATSDSTVGHAMLQTQGPDSDSLMMTLRARGEPALMATSNNRRWLSRYGAAFVRGEVGSAPAITVSPSGDVTIAGTLTTGSSRAIKHDIEAIDPRTELARVRGLRVATWTYDADATESAHMGPMAEDVYAELRVGTDPSHVAPADIASGALAAAQALLAEHDAQRERIASLRQKNLALRDRLERLERALENQ